VEIVRLFDENRVDFKIAEQATQGARHLKLTLSQVSLTYQEVSGRR
jgi:hypothetical protein